MDQHHSIPTLLPASYVLVGRHEGPLGYVASITLTLGAK